MEHVTCTSAPVDCLNQLAGYFHQIGYGEINPESRIYEIPSLLVCRAVTVVVLPPLVALLTRTLLAFSRGQRMTIN